ncbi:hypothetical protein [Streptomyces turgidiscabies]|uniref:hypothetical protein n=1 Tax=Streptomyces turgidiscabies TaxID=85558 RepID=UPI0038F668F9
MTSAFLVECTGSSDERDRRRPQPTRVQTTSDIDKENLIVVSDALGGCGDAPGTGGSGPEQPLSVMLAGEKSRR